MKNRKGLYLLQTMVGIVLIIIRGFVLNTEEVKMASGLFIGIGAACTALGLVWFIQSLVISESKMKKLKRQMAIEQIDERDIRIRERTGFMGVDKLIIAIAALVLVIKFVLVVFFSNYYSKSI